MCLKHVVHVCEIRVSDVFETSGVCMRDMCV